MKKRLCVGVLLLAILLQLCPCTLADSSGIDVVRKIEVEGKPSVVLEVRLKDNAGQSVRSAQHTFSFTAGTEKTVLSAIPANERNNGHIIVVDTSLYYYGLAAIRIENIQDVVLAYLSRLSSDARVMFVLASDAKQPTCTAYMSLEQAKEFASSLAFAKEKSANLNTAIYQAFTYAVSPEEGAPKFNSVMIVADPDIQNNKDDTHSLAECAHLRASEEQWFSVTMAVPYRDQFFQVTSDERRSELNNNIATLENFVLQCGGVLVKVPQTNQGVSTEELHTVLSRYLETSTGFEVDLSPLSGRIPTEPQLQQVTLTIGCDNVSRDITCTVDTALLPPPIQTPDPVVDSVTPAPTPVVVLGQSDDKAVMAMKALRDLNYLEQEDISSFNSDGLSAYIDFCKANDIEVQDGIYEQTLALMISGNVIAKPIVTPEPTATPVPTPTPTPTATPQPTVPPQGYMINAQDTEGSGGFIAQMQNILKSLNCYSEDSISNIGRLDQATLDAVNRYCEAYNWSNDTLDGVSGVIVMDILTNGAGHTPIEAPEPTLSSRIREFLQGSLTIGSVTVPNWILVVVGFVLIIVIVVVLIVTGKGSQQQTQTLVRPDSDKEKAKSNLTTSPVEDDDPTVGAGQTRYLRLEITYAGHTRVLDGIALSEGKDLAIGRKDANGRIPDPDIVLDSTDKSVSRGRHAVLRLRGGNVYLHDESTYHNTTMHDMNVYDRETQYGLLIASGDEFALSAHNVRVSW